MHKEDNFHRNCYNERQESQSISQSVSQSVRQTDRQTGRTNKPPLLRRKAGALK